MGRSFALAAGGAGAAGPTHDGYDPNAPMGAHDHSGEIGELLLLVERSIKCNCSCGLDVHSCQYQMMCGVSPGWTQRIRASLEAGEGIEEIQASFVADYGGTVLMAPPPEGFNLVGYLLPGAAIITMAFLVGIVARGGAAGRQLAPVVAPTDEQSAKLDAALRRLDETEGPDW